MISDTELSLGITTTSELKARALAKNWGVMFAGEITYAENVIDEAQRLLSQETVTAKKAATAMTQSYQSVRRARLEEQYLGTYGWTMQQFLEQGPDVPSPTHRQYLLDSFDRYDLGCQFLVAGFSAHDSQFPTIFEVDNPGIYVDRSIVGYAAIGSGANSAITYLASHSQQNIDPLWISLYNAIAAKRVGERAPGVGNETTALILSRGQDHPEDVRWLQQEEATAINDIWEKEEANIRPHNLEQRIRSVIEAKQLASQKSASGQ
jgi:hypothetical protein